MSTDATVRPSIVHTAGSVLHAVILAAGPWLFTIIALAAIGYFAAPLVGDAAVETFSGFVIYAFAVPLLATAPITMVASRLLSDDLHGRRLDRLRPLFVATLTLCAATTAVLSAMVFLLLGVPTGEFVVGIMLCTLVATIWVGVGFLASIRDFNYVAATFAGGLMLGVFGTVGVALAGGAATEMLLGFAVGLSAISTGLTARVLATFTLSADGLGGAISRLAAGLSLHRALAVGVVVAVLGVWLDKWIVWGSALGYRMDGGLLHAPIYDSPMFVAYLTVIPSLALFMSMLDGAFSAQHRAYANAIEKHATLAEIERRSAALVGSATEIFFRVLVLQGALSASVVFLAPVVIELAGFEYRQLTVLRYGVVGAMFQVLFTSASVLLLYFGRDRRFLALQAGFATLLAITTTLSLFTSDEHLGLGYLITAVIGGTTAILVLLNTLQKIDYFTFVSGNAARPRVP